MLYKVCGVTKLLVLNKFTVPATPLKLEIRLHTYLVGRTHDLVLK